MSLRVFGEPLCVGGGVGSLGCSKTLSARQIMRIVVIEAVVQPLVARQMTSGQ